jgi:F-type H+-transporting ATPase subunit gamma
MASLSELRKQIKGIKSTRKITRAMKMVAGARFNKAQLHMQNSRKYSEEMSAIMSQLVASAEQSKKVQKLITFEKDIPLVNVGLMVITGDKGLCGDFNSAVIKETDKILKNKENSITCLFTVGKKASDYYKKITTVKQYEYINVFNNLDYAFADRLGQELLKKFDEHKLSAIVVVSSHFKSMIKKDISIIPLVPVFIDKSIKSVGCMYEPIDENELLCSSLPFVIKATLYRMLRESYVAEISQRMRAMDNATTNAGKLIEKITLDMNKVRQSSITREIAEIIGTNEVIK